MDIIGLLLPVSLGLLLGYIMARFISYQFQRLFDDSGLNKRVIDVYARPIEDDPLFPEPDGPMIDVHARAIQRIASGKTMEHKP